MKSAQNKYPLFSIIILFFLGLFQAPQAIYFYDAPDIIDKILNVIVVLFMCTVVPLVIATVASFIFKKQFSKVFVKCLLFISIPLFLITSYGSYSLYKEKNEKNQYKRLKQHR